MCEYIGNFLIEDNTGKSDSPFWVYIDNGFKFVAPKYFPDYISALEYVHLNMGDY